ncbi:MAG: hypothetical protein HQ461_08390 [Deltaproteobacteria bacterium]|nr:hypothetical protein [Deltaproteobacteria bacterium]
MNSPVPRIPNRFVLLWTGSEFPLHCRLAVESLLQVDPDCAVEVHLFGEEPLEAPHFKPLLGRDRVTLHRISLDTVFQATGDLAAPLRALYSRIPASARSAQSNLLRYAILYDRGGIYVDFDILALHDFRHLLHHAAFVGEEQVWKVNKARVEGRREPWMVAPTLSYLAAYALSRGWSLAGGRSLAGSWLVRKLDAAWSRPNLNNAVIGAEPRSAFVRRLLVAALDASPTRRFALGPTLISDAWQADSSEVERLPSSAFYFEPPTYSFRFFEGAAVTPPAAALLVHYVNSNHPKQLEKLSLEVIEARRLGPLFYQLADGVCRRAGMLPQANA